MTPVILCFGCPRSGTTYLKEWLELGTGYVVKKISETSVLHPINSDNGIKAIFDLFKDDPVFFVWIDRNPFEIAKSFFAARSVEYHRLPEVYKSPMPKMTGIAKNSDARILKIISNWKINWNKQRDQVNSFCVEYERLGDLNYCEEKIRLLTKIKGFPNPKENRLVLLEFIKDSWKKNPVRGGRLSYDIDVKLPDQFRDKLFSLL